jgi:hypothetical protein
MVLSFLIDILSPGKDGQVASSMVLTAYSENLDLIQHTFFPWVLRSSLGEKDGQTSLCLLFLLLHLQCIQLGAHGTKYISLEVL